MILCTGPFNKKKVLNICTDNNLNPSPINSKEKTTTTVYGIYYFKFCQLVRKLQLRESDNFKEADKQLRKDNPSYRTDHLFNVHQILVLRFVKRYNEEDK